MIFQARFLVSHSIVILISTVLTFEACAYQPSEVPAVPVEPGSTVAANPTKTDPPAESRIAIDARLIADAAGEELGAELTPLLLNLFDAERSDAERLESAAELKSLVSQLDPGDRKLQSVSRQVKRRVRLAEAAISGLQAATVTDETRALVNDMLIRTAVDFENGNRIAHMEIARRHYDEIRRSHPEVYARIRPVFLDEYFNFNLHFVLSEQLLSRMLSDSRSERGGIAECILGAWVTGTQDTDTTIRADVKPSQNRAMFNILVDGHTTSITQGTKSPAVIYTRGNHHFNIVKPTWFDGQRFSSAPADMDVHANNQTTGVSTKYDGIPIIRGIARNIARKEAAKKKTQSESIAAGKMARRALPRLESEVGNKFAEANADFQNHLLANLRRRGIAPDQYSARSSETHMAVSSRTLSPVSLAAPKPPSTPAPRRGVAVQMHETAMNAAIESLGFSGRMSTAEVLEKIEIALEELTKKKVSLRDPAVPQDDNTDFDFDEQDAIRVRFDENQVIFIMRTGFYQKDKDRRIPRHSFEIPIGIELRGGQLTLIPPKTDNQGILSIKPRAIEERSSLRTVVQARAIAKELLDKTFKKPEIDVDPNVDVKLADGSVLKLRTTTFNMTDGWVTAVLQ